MQLTFPSDKSIELSFKVGIAGTNSAPSSVAIVLERNSTALSFKAVNGGSDEWTAIIDNPGSVFEAGEVNLSVNIVLNNRLFTPMKSTATIEAVAKTAPEAPVNEPVQLNTDTQSNEIPAMEEVNQVEQIKDIFKSSSSKPVKTESIIERVTVAPIKLQLLKSIEKGTTTVKPKPIVAEQVISKKKSNTLSIKKTKVVYL
jgi:hypothetical protein